MDNITIINLLQKRIKKLEVGPCRFDCRAKREKDFMAGFDAGLAYPDKEPGEAWQEWRDEQAGL